METKEASSCFATQVEAMTSIGSLQPFENVIDVQLDTGANSNSVLFSAREDKFQNLGQHNCVMLLSKAC